jgi:hypothetical protein
VHPARVGLKPARIVVGPISAQTSSESHHERPADLPAIGPPILSSVLSHSVSDTLARTRIRLWRQQTHTPTRNTACAVYSTKEA